MCSISIGCNEDYISSFQAACYASDLEKVKYFIENKLFSVNEGPIIISGCINSHPKFFLLIEYLLEKGIPEDFYLFALPEFMDALVQDLYINGYSAETVLEDKFYMSEFKLVFDLNALINGMSKDYYNKTAMDIFFEKFSETDIVFQMPIIQKLIHLGARRFSDLSHQERVLNSDVITAMQYSLDDLKFYFADRNVKGWHYPGLRFSGVLVKICKLAKQEHLSFDSMLEKIEFVAFQHVVVHVLDILYCFLSISRNNSYSPPVSYSPTELCQVLQMLFRHEELSWQFELSEVNNPHLIDEIAAYLRSGGYHEVAEQFLARASLV